MLKQFILRWLGFPASADAPAPAPMAEAKDPTEVDLAKWQMNALHQRMSANYENTLRQVFMLETKVNAMAEIMGVAVVFSDEDRDSAIIKILDETKIGITKEFVDAGVAIEKAMAMHYHCMRDQAALFSELFKRRDQELAARNYKKGR